MIIGLTGGIASGKSLCTTFFASNNIPVVDADVIARNIVQTNTPVLNQLVRQLGKNILLADGSLNRATLRNLIFANPEIKKIVNQIMHPVIQEISQDNIYQALQTYPFVIYSAPLLFENNLNKQCQSIIVIDVPIELQISRGIKRDDVSKHQLMSIISTQTPRIEKLSLANYIIDNSQTKEKTFFQCKRLLNTLRK